MTSFYEWGSTGSWLQSHLEEAVYFLPFTRKDESLSQPWSHQVFLNTVPLDWEFSTLGVQPINIFEPLMFTKSRQTGTDRKTNKNENQQCF